MNHRKIRTLGVAFRCALVASLVGCSSIQVSSQKDPQANLASLHTYAWQRPKLGSPTNTIVDAQIERSVQANLAQIGIEAAPQGTPPDFLISYNTSVMNIVTPRTAGGVGVGMGVTPGVGVGFSAPLGTQTETSEQGTLALSFIDPQKNQEIWHATATTQIDRTNRDLQKLQDSIQKMISEFKDARG